MRCAAVIAKLSLAPVVMVDMAFGGDNHQDVVLTETNQTLEMIVYLMHTESPSTTCVADEVVFANLDVFGDPNRTKTDAVTTAAS